ncbi:hypothetical protein [Pedobacter sp. GR22-10]|uniref:hypothetical protein n=1 Tax=Pedobacter sp. GR22-10 TaxID=2994472 RepID=UPI002245A79E|nr:hypothetical protein [Pedobacter sp. GR22-10]MCX2429872.1 hypothetical protein [Pedobacter sp. GR22-10]
MEALFHIRTAKFVGLILVLAGCLLRHWMKSRSFNRRNKMGVELFRNHTHQVLLTSFERLLKLLGRLLMILGLIIIGADWIKHH